MHDRVRARFHRRDFLRRGCGVAGALALGGGLAGARSPAPRPTLILLRLAGGNDGLSTVVPYGDDAYYRARTSTRIEAREVLRLDDYRGLHPALGNLHALFGEGRLAIVEGVGVPAAPRTHFAARGAWDTACDQLLADAHVETRELAGFDTHNDQRRRHDAAMRTLDFELAALLRRLETSAAGRATTVLVYSEFGRTLTENGLGGTDHGAAGPVFVAGARVRGGVYGTHPSLTELDDGRLVPAVDFRSVCAEPSDPRLGFLTPPAASCAGA